MKINVKPYQIKVGTFPTPETTVEIVEVEVDNIRVELNHSMIAHISFNTASDKYVSSATFEMTPEEYSNWGNNDEYVVTLILQRYNLEAA